ncbi:hypothetical protein [Nocardia sp. NPDC049526]|uniref:hypothetical protein n=1 Tax=Nocardia sp. NPDC049526 TaxID=3364316 RepID=UPI003796A2E8
MTIGDHRSPLPVRLRPLPGETTESFVVCLALADHLKLGYLHRTTPRSLIISTRRLWDADQQRSY